MGKNLRKMDTTLLFRVDSKYQVKKFRLAVLKIFACGFDHIRHIKCELANRADQYYV